MATITDQGIKGRTLNEYLQDIQTRQLAIDPNWNIQADSPDGQKNAIDAELLANLDEAVVEAYNSKDPDRATGEALNMIGKISGVPRQEATFSIAPVSVTGQLGFPIPALSQVRNRIDNSLWLTISPIVIDAGGLGSGFVRAAEAGRKLADVGELTIIGTPSAGWSSVTNPGAATPGQDAESDIAYRIRRDNSVSRPGSNQVDNMFAEVGSVSGVTDVKVYENYSKVTDANGIPGNSIAVVVNGGSDEDVCYAMYKKKNPGATMFPQYDPVNEDWVDDPGENGVQVYVESPVTGNVASITFQRAIALPIYIEYTIRQVGLLPSDIAERIKTAVLRDAQRSLFGGNPSVGFNQRGYDIGEIVPVGRQYTAANKVLGLYGDSYVESIRIGRSPQLLGSAPIQPAYNELPLFDEEYISVFVL